MKKTHSNDNNSRRSRNLFAFDANERNILINAIAVLRYSFILLLKSELLFIYNWLRATLFIFEYLHKTASMAWHKDRCDTRTKKY